MGNCLKGQSAMNPMEQFARSRRYASGLRLLPAPDGNWAIFASADGELLHLGPLPTPERLREWSAQADLAYDSRRQRERALGASADSRPRINGEDLGL